MSEKGKQALLLLGSPHAWGGTSAALGLYLLDQLSGHGIAAEKLAAQAALSAAGRDDLLRAVEAADIIILSFPLYVDSLPASLIAALESLAAAKERNWTAKQLVCLVNCGFPEAEQCRPALAICRRFAVETGMRPADGLAFGMGGILGGKQLDEMGGMMKNARAALEMSAAALSRGEDIPAAAVALMAKTPIPNWLYTAVGNYSWKALAKKNGVAVKLKDRPYCQG